jgi:hypothetical protein
MNNLCIFCFSRIFLLGILIFKGLAARRHYKSFVVKGLKAASYFKSFYCFGLLFLKPLPAHICNWCCLNIYTAVASW